MHANSQVLMHEMALGFFEANYPIRPEGAPKFKVLDVGSCDVNGSYRGLFPSEYFEYTGLDAEPGKNVDLVVGDDVHWGSRPEMFGAFDLVISGQCLEHCKYPWDVCRSMFLACREFGTAFVIVPDLAPLHRYPIDCYRFLPDGLRAMMEWAGWSVEGVGSSSACDGWGDCWCVAHKRAQQNGPTDCTP